eukprot:1179829-Prorocentrum_minimum.AAC.2
MHVFARVFVFALCDARVATCKARDPFPCSSVRELSVRASDTMIYRWYTDGIQRFKVGNWTQGEKWGRVSRVLSAPLPLLTQENL